VLNKNNFKNAINKWIEIVWAFNMRIRDDKKKEYMIGVRHEEFCRGCRKNGPQRIETRCSRSKEVTSGDAKSAYICTYRMSSL
jgi:hypothetical protein